MLQMLHFLFAALVYHYDYLKANLDQNSKLVSSQVFMAVENFSPRGQAVAKFPWEMTEYTPHPTGIPPHVMILNQLEAMQKQMTMQVDEICVRMSTNVAKKLDDRKVGGSELGMKKSMEKIESMFKTLIAAAKQQNQGAKNQHLYDGDDSVDGNSGDLGTIKYSDGDLSGTEANHQRPRKVRKFSLDWKNCRNGKVTLVPPEFVQFPKLTFMNLII